MSVTTIRFHPGRPSSAVLRQNLELHRRQRYPQPLLPSSAGSVFRFSRYDSDTGDKCDDGENGTHALVLHISLILSMT